MKKIASVRVVSPRLWNVENDNIDVEVMFEDGSRHGATFFTLSNVETLFRRNAETGECSAGLYFWASSMILVRDLSLQTIQRTVEGLLATAEFDHAFEQL